MTINARNIVPGKAINQITYMFLGNMRLRKEDKSVHIQSHYLEVVRASASRPSRSASPRRSTTTWKTSAPTR